MGITPAVVSVVPALIDALISQSRDAFAEDGAPNATVYDGWDSTEQAGNYLMVGVQDLDNDGYDTAARSVQDWSSTGNDAYRSETGDVTCAAVVWVGDDNPKKVRDRVYAVIGTVAAMCRQTPTLGVPEMQWTSFGTSSELTTGLSDDGESLAMVLFTVHFVAEF